MTIYETFWWLSWKSLLCNIVCPFLQQKKLKIFIFFVKVVVKHQGKIFDTFINASLNYIYLKKWKRWTEFLHHILTVTLINFILLCLISSEMMKSPFVSFHIALPEGRADNSKCRDLGIFITLHGPPHKIYPKLWIDVLFWSLLRFRDLFYGCWRWRVNLEFFIRSINNCNIH